MLLTETANPASANLDQLSTIDLVALMNREDQRVPEAIHSQLPQIARAIDAIAERMRQGGRLISIGAGTSGRLAALDAAECPPTFNTKPGQVVAIMAGGNGAFEQAVEGAEDDQVAGEHAASIVEALDSFIGIAASGTTPFVFGGMAEARRRGALVISVACNHPSPMANIADIAIAPLVGPEVLTGSTRLKAGSAQKMVLNMLSTGVMVRLGKTYGNLMVDVQQTNHKLRLRAQRIVAEACSIGLEQAQGLLDRCGGQVKLAIVVGLTNETPDEAQKRLDLAGGAVRGALEQQ